jgi:hypothetical protein
MIAEAPDLETVEISRPSTIISQELCHKRIQQRLAQLFEDEDEKLKVNNSTKRLDTLIYDHGGIFEGLTDISKLERLHTGNIWSPEYFREQGATRNKLESLKDLAVDLERCQGLPALEHFLETCNPLERLSVSDSLGQLSLEKWLPRHRDTLRRLELHETETHSHSLTNRRFIISKDEIQLISKSCPGLEDLTIDLAQSDDGKSERALFAILASFPKLTQVGLHLDLGIIDAMVASRTTRNGIDKSIQDNLNDINPFSPKNPSWVENMWTVLRHKKEIQCTVQLKELQVKVGEWDK